MIDTTTPPQQRTQPVGLVRYGVVPEVARCDLSSVPDVARGTEVVVETHRGLMIGRLLDIVRPPVEPQREAPPDPSFRALREATSEDLQRAADLAQKASGSFGDWHARIAKWNLELQLIDIEWTLDGDKQILYVLNDRGPECTKLALQAAAAGLGTVEVQPVSKDGLVTLPPTGGGCGSGGSCGCG